ncbi:tetratricopeptide repeat protein [Caenimonas sp. SL110]|uniref:tetratricopeptide repeat protein n=1 Tax=Caenimonas sp. SL110 TaxID=1450524 RepID=UPI00069ECE79|nr:tetratricopeptide repeat protein [Caenimonas sp. SL110]
MGTHTNTETNAGLRSQGNALLAEGRIAEATQCYERACNNDPTDSLAWLNQGYGRLVMGEVERASQCLRRALTLDGALTDAHFLLGQIDSGQPEAALVHFEAALVIDPAHAGALQGASRALYMMGRHVQALDHLDRWLAVVPGDFDALQGRAAVLLELGRNEEALAAASQVLASQPDSIDALDHASAACLRLGGFDEGLSLLRHGLAVDPQHAGMHWNRGLALLTLGRLEEGWPEFEWRWQATVLAHARPSFMSTHPAWRGEDLRGKSLLLHAEQGLGDTIQFVRFAPLLAARGARVLLLVPESLRDLCSRMPGCEVFADERALPPFDFHCPMMSVPAVWQMTMQAIAAPLQYLRSDAVKRELWDTRLGRRHGLRIGLVWSGGTLHRNDANRSMSLSTLLPALPPGNQLVSLQKEVRDADRGALTASGILDFSGELRTFDDTAALADCMDVIVSVDTSVAHLAGALGKPLILMLSDVPDWRWMLERGDSPWYPTARLFRQDERSKWHRVIQNVRAALTRLAV